MAAVGTPKEALADHLTPVDLLTLYEVLEFCGHITPARPSVTTLLRHAVRPLLVANPVGFVSRAEWKARTPTSTTALSTARGNTLHWEGPHMGPFPHESCATKVRGIQAFHMDSRGWADIAYSSVVCPHGYIFEGRWYNRRTAANGTNQGNDVSYAHCYLSGTGDPFDIDAKKGLRRVFEYFENRGSGTSRWAHRDWRLTECPGDAQTTWLSQGMPVGSPPTPTPTPPETCTVILPVLREGAHSGAVKALQGLLVLKASQTINTDGIFGPATTTAVKNVQRFFGLTQDGIVGDKTWGALFL